MLLDLDAATLANMSVVLLRERDGWTVKQWRNQCQFFAALCTEVEHQALRKGQPDLADRAHEIAWRFAADAIEGPRPARSPCDEDPRRD